MQQDPPACLTVGCGPCVAVAVGPLRGCDARQDTNMSFISQALVLMNLCTPQSLLGDGCSR